MVAEPFTLRNTRGLDLGGAGHKLLQVSAPLRLRPIEPTARLKVAILSEDALLTAALARALEDDALEVTSEGAEVTLWDGGLHAEGMAALVTSLRAEALAVVALVPSISDGERALAAGAKGVLLRERIGPHIASALFAAHAGLTVLDQAFAASLLRAAPPGPPVVMLTAREREVLVLVAEGLSNKRIARRLGISEHTAKFHVNRILEKLDADTRTEAVVRAMRHGMLMV